LDLSDDQGCVIVSKVQREMFDEAIELSRLRRLDTNIGASCSFVGLCRDEGGVVSALEIEHYPEMARRELTAIAARAAARFSLFGVVLIHRYGYLVVGEEIVLVAAAAAHRADAFEAVDFMMDYLKTDAPFWKKAHYSDGRDAWWISPASRDFSRRSRWEPAHSFSK